MNDFEININDSIFNFKRNFTDNNQICIDFDIKYFPKDKTKEDKLIDILIAFDLKNCLYSIDDTCNWTHFYGLNPLFLEQFSETKDFKFIIEMIDNLLKLYKLPLNIIEIYQQRKELCLEAIEIINSPTKECELNKKECDIIKIQQGYVYVIESNFLYKIGKAKNLETRIKQLKTGSPNIVNLIYAKKFNNDYNKTELYLHNKFKKLRKHGEWFELSQKDLEYIKNVTEEEIYGQNNN